MPIYEINPHLVKISKQKNVSVDFVNALNHPLWMIIFSMVARGGIEPPTQGFSVLCSTD